MGCAVLRSQFKSENAVADPVRKESQSSTTQGIVVRQSANPESGRCDLVGDGEAPEGKRNTSSCARALLANNSQF